VAPRQYFTTTIFDPEGAGEATFLVAPKSAFAQPALLDHQDALAEILEVPRLHRVDEALDIWPALAVVLSEDENSLRLLDEQRPEEWLQVLAKVAPSAKRGFASYCASAPVIPFEESRLAAASLLSIVSKATTGAGAAVGFILAGGATPLALVLVPAGMIIFGSAAGVARGLQQGLEYRVKKALGAPTSDRERELPGPRGPGGA
jgi:hypothetical protein